VPILETVDLTKYYRQGSAVVRALDGVSLRIEARELVAIMGRSGSGKTTLLDLLGLLQPPTSGRVLLSGVDVSRLRQRSVTQLRRRRVGLVFQEYNLLGSLTALENVLLPLRYERSADLAKGLRRATDLLELVGMGDRASHRPGQLSGGQRQRVALARALILRPAVVLADEPTAAVDSETAADLLHLVRLLNVVEHVTFVLVTHDPEVAAVAKRVIRLRDGRLESDRPVVLQGGAPPRRPAA
jgi:putative ABC transport system ATP-binding protein